MKTYKNTVNTRSPKKEALVGKRVQAWPQRKDSDTICFRKFTTTDAPVAAQYGLSKIYLGKEAPEFLRDRFVCKAEY